MGTRPLMLNPAKCKIWVVLSLVVFLQVSPVIFFMFVGHYSDSQINQKVSACTESFLAQDINVLLKAKAEGTTVYGSPEEIKRVQTPAYKDLCERIVFKQTFNIAIYGFLAVFVLYVMPSMLLTYKLVFGRGKVNCSLVIAIVLLVILGGFVLNWDFGLSDHIHSNYGGNILF